MLLGAIDQQNNCSFYKMNSTYRLQIELEHSIGERRRLVTEGLDALGIDLDIRR